MPTGTEGPASSAASIHALATLALSPPEALWEEDGERRLDALDRIWLAATPAPIVRIAAHAVLIGFPDVQHAVTFAEQAAAEVARLEFGRLRVAIVSGTPDLRHDPVTGRATFAGPAVRALAQLLRHTAPGEIRLDEASRDALDPFDTLQTSEGWILRVREPPAHTLAPLPVFDGPFVGRAELDATIAALSTDRLVVLHGPGGAGKTRLAVEAAAIHARRCGEGVAFVGLQSARSADDVLVSLASALRIDLSDTGTERLVAGLRSLGRTLVIIDNVEQVLEPVAALLETVLSHTRYLRVLVTSRFRLAHAQTIEVGGMSPEDALTLLADQTPRSSSWTPEDLDDAQRLAARLDRLPLALRLAGAQLDLWRPGQLLDRMALVFDSQAPERHATLTATIDWSLSLLEPTVRRALLQLSAFRGSFEVEDAERLLRLGDGEVGAVIRALVDASLLRIIDERPRFVLYEQVRHVAQSHLERDLDREAVAARHAEWAIRDVRQWFDGTRGEHSAARIERVRRELPDLLHVLEHGAPEVACWASAALEVEDLGATLEVHLKWLDRGVAAAETSGEPSTIGLLLTLRARLLGRFGRVPAAQADLARAESIADAARDPVLRARTLLLIGWLPAASGDLAAGQARCDEARALARAAGATVIEAVASAALGRIAMLGGDLVTAERWCSAGVHLLERASDDYGLGLALVERANVRRLLRLPDADADLDRAETILRKVGHQAGQDGVDNVRMLFALGREDEASVMSIAEDQLARARARGEASWEAGALFYIGRARQFFGRDHAEAPFRQALEMAQPADQTWVNTFSILGLVGVETERGDLDSAERRLLALGEVRGVIVPVVTLWQGVFAALRGDLDFAEAKCSEIAHEPCGLDALIAVERARASGDVAAAEYAIEHSPNPTPSRADRRAVLRIARARLAPAQTSAAWVVAADGRHFIAPSGERVDLGRRATLRRIIAFLADLRASDPGQAADLNQLLAAGWPDEQVSWESAANRIYVAIATLRKLGLSGVLITRDDGYLLDPAVALQRVAPLPPG